MRPISERTANAFEDAAESKQAKDTNQQRNERPSRSQNQDRNSNTRNSDRNGDRNNDRNSDNRRYNSDRRSNGDRNNDRKPNGDRNFRGPRNEGGQSDRFKRLSNDRNQGDRNNDRNSDRNNDRNNRFKKETVAAAPAEDVRGKEGRDRNNDRRNNKHNNNNQNRDKLGKKQENYINLEKHGGKKKNNKPQPQPKEDDNEIKTITLPEKITIRDLADKMKIQPSAIVKKLFLKGEMVTVNSEVDFAAAEEIALEFNFICEEEEKSMLLQNFLKKMRKMSQQWFPVHLLYV